MRILFEAGEMVTATASLADEMIELIAEALGAQVLIVEPGSEQEIELIALLTADDEEDDEALLEPRPPVITVMGHVDHGKTTLLDRIRNANVVAGEAGGITQHIGAYQVDRDGRRITFIDTPGHEAFTAMRSRGAQVTDIAILVVAADDGVMPQTIEAISHARAAEVPIVVAVTKIDREDADPTRVRQQLTEQELVPEEWGGNTIVLDVSAPTGVGVEELLDALLLVADVEIAEDLVANPNWPAKAYVLESNLDQGRGPVVTALIEEGTLRVGDTIVAGPAWGRVRAMFDEHGQQVSEAGPSVPVEVLGLDDVPLAGDELRVAPTDKVARTVAEARAHRRKVAAQRNPMMLGGGARLEDIFAMVQRGEVATLNLIVKADVHGSLEALTDALRKLDEEHDEVRLSFVLRGVGGITESDLNLAAVSNATVIGFNVRPDRKAREVAGTRRRRDAPLRGHLRRARRRQQRARRHAQARVRRGRHRRRRGPRGLLGAARRQGRRLLRHERRHHAGLEGSVPARRHDHLEGPDRVAAAVQGRRPRGPRRLRVRYRPRELPGPQGRRRHRDLRSESRATHAIATAGYGWSEPGGATVLGRTRGARRGAAVRVRAHPPSIELPRQWRRMRTRPRSVSICTSRRADR